MVSACRVALVAAMIASATASNASNASNASAGASKNIFVAGDSMGEYSAQVIETFCKGSKVYNGAVGGATAVQWTGSGALTTYGLAGAKCGGKPDYIWLSVGGNDVLNTGCGDTETKENITAKVTASIDSVKASAPGVKILITGYCMASGAEAERRLFETEKIQTGNPSTPRRLACSSPEKFMFIGDAIKIAAEKDADVTYVDSTEACGGTSGGTKWSDKRYFADAVHLNNQGYCKVFTQTKVQEFFGCESATYDCESLTCAITGYSSCSGEGSKSECATCEENCVKGSGTTGSGTTGNATTSTIGAAMVSLSQTITIQYLTVGIVASSLLGYWF